MDEKKKDKATILRPSPPSLPPQRKDDGAKIMELDVTSVVRALDNISNDVDRNELFIKSIAKNVETLSRQLSDNIKVAQLLNNNLFAMMSHLRVLGMTREEYENAYRDATGGQEPIKGLVNSIFNMKE